MIHSRSCRSDRLISVLVPALQLLHHLFYGPAYQPGAEIPAYADLPHVLMHSGAISTAPAFNALDHTYIVTMARLGYADVPEWLGRERVRIVDDIAGKSFLNTVLSCCRTPIYTRNSCFQSLRESF
jgi:hypothetical protein